MMNCVFPPQTFRIGFPTSGGGNPQDTIVYLQGCFQGQELRVKNASNILFHSKCWCKDMAILSSKSMLGYCWTYPF